MEEVKNEARESAMPPLWFADELEEMIKYAFGETVLGICAGYCEGYVDEMTALGNIIGAKKIVDRLLAKIR